MQLVELLHRWGFAVLGGALLLVAFLVNQFAPQRRHRIRYALLLYVLFLVTTGLSSAMAYVPSMASGGEHVRLLADLLAAFTLVNVIALAVFDVALPSLRVVGISFATITTDVIVGFAYVFAALGVLKSAGVSPSSVVTTSAVVSGVLALSMQATLGNIVGGVALQLDGSLHVGDWVQLPDGTQGRIVAIRWRHTLLETRDWDTVIVPNSNLLAQNIVILGKRSGKPLLHRTWVQFNVDFRYGPSRVIDVVHEALVLAPIEGVAEDPGPSVICYDFAKDGRNSFGLYAVRYWLTDLPNADPISSRIRTRIFTALQRAGIPLARPSQTIFTRPEESPEQRGARDEDQRLRAVQDGELFRTLTTEERAFIASHLRFAPFTAGETCTKQGAVAHWLYVLTSGKVQVRRHVEGGTLAKVIATIEAPSFFGEMGLMAGEPRAADVIALTDVECYRLDKIGLARVLEERPEIAEQFSKTLAERRVELFAASENLDAQARNARVASEQNRILDRIQVFFGLERTTKI